MNGGNLLKATGLWSRTSARGSKYLVGRWGGLKVLVLENRDKVADQDPTHVLYFAEPTERPTASVPTTSGNAPPRPTRRRVHNAYQHLAPDGVAVTGGARPLDDSLDDLWGGKGDD